MQRKVNIASIRPYL